MLATMALLWPGASGDVVFSTPIILLAMSADGSVDPMLLEDHLTATLAAAAIVVTANLLMDRALRRL